MLLCNNTSDKASLDINEQDQEGNTPAHLAATNNSEMSLRLLMRSGADLTLTNDRGDTVYSILLKNHEKIPSDSAAAPSELLDLVSSVMNQQVRCFKEGRLHLFHPHSNKTAAATTRTTTRHSSSVLNGSWSTMWCTIRGCFLHLRELEQKHHSNSNGRSGSNIGNRKPDRIINVTSASISTNKQDLPTGAFSLSFDGNKNQSLILKADTESETSEWVSLVTQSIHLFSDKDIFGTSQSMSHTILSGVGDASDDDHEDDDHEDEDNNNDTDDEKEEVEDKHQKKSIVTSENGYSSSSSPKLEKMMDKKGEEQQKIEAVTGENDKDALRAEIVDGKATLKKDKEELLAIFNDIDEEKKKARKSLSGKIPLIRKLSASSRRSSVIGHSAINSTSSHPNHISAQTSPSSNSSSNSSSSTLPTLSNIFRTSKLRVVESKTSPAPGQILKEGALSISGSSRFAKLKSRWVVLSSSPASTTPTLFCYRKQADPKPMRVIKLENAIHLEADSSKKINSFRITLKKRSTGSRLAADSSSTMQKRYTFQCQSNVQYSEWTQLLSRVIPSSGKQTFSQNSQNEDPSSKVNSEHVSFPPARLRAATSWDTSIHNEDDISISDSLTTVSFHSELSPLSMHYEGSMGSPSLLSRSPMRKSLIGKNNDNVHAVHSNSSVSSYPNPEIHDLRLYTDDADHHHRMDGEAMVRRERTNSLLYVEVEEEEEEIEDYNPFGSLDYPKYPWNMYISAHRSSIPSNTNLRQSAIRFY
eukprot:TRINITY_DN6096_c0_g1_i1.p1 TRINITY_DN6096_c0_g1~~TRINITY_DN6096_c0_g1_i1.p1  ORF type:complete len:756 (-),score=154.54 TRINITY_DN6096_c0_g1_i1:118-2385(-)